MHSSDRGVTSKVVRVHVAARMLGCSPRTIRRLIQHQEIPAMRLGRRAWGIRACDLKQEWDETGGDRARY
jgi:excisionase family DNA binding protein